MEPIRLLNLRYWLQIHFCMTWYPGYQLCRTGTMNPYYTLDLLIIPGFMISIGLPSLEGIRYWKDRREWRRKHASL